jgi:choline dehydrogenase
VLEGFQRKYIRAYKLTHANSVPRYSIATKGTFQKWADTVGDANYTWNKIFPYLQKSTTSLPPNVAARSANSREYQYHHY